MASIEKRKLNSRHRVMMANLAAATFIDEGLRQAEADAQETFLNAVVEAAEAVPVEVMDVFRSYGQTGAIDHINVCRMIVVKDGIRKLPKPNGEVVERENTVTYYMTRKGNLSWSSWAETTGVHAGSESALHEGSWRRRMALPKEVEIPGTVEISHDGGRRSIDINESAHPDNLWKTWFEPARPALIAWFKAMDARAKQETRLLQAALKLIGASTVYGEVLAVWPEVRALEADMFGEPNLTKTALVCLNDDDRALLCGHMSRRGVTSAVCGVTPSPDFASAAE